MKIRHLANRAFGMFFFALMFAVVMTSCDDDSENSPGGQHGYSVQVEVSYTSDCDPRYVDGVVLSFPSKDEESELVTLGCNETWTKTLTYDEVPSVVGLVATPALKDDLRPGTDVKVGYKVKCSVKLKLGNDIIDFKEVRADDEFLVDTDEISQLVPVDLIHDFLFNVTDKGIGRVRLSDIFSDETVDVGNLPTIDSDKVKAKGTLYYFSQASDDTDEDCLCDNFIARFSSKVKWNGNALGRGDFLLLYKSDIEKANRDVLRESLSNGAVVVLADLESYSVLTGFCSALNLYNPIVENEVDVSHSMFIVADADVSLAPAGSAPWRSLFFVLSPKKDSGESVSDYGQGEIIDRAVIKLNDIFTKIQPVYLGVSGEGGNNDLQKLVGARKFYICEGGLSHELKKSDYRKESMAKGENPSNTYDVEYDIWNVFSLEEKRNYYYIHQEFICSFAPCYVGVYNSNVKTKGCNTIAKVCEWYGSMVELTTESDTPHMQIHRNSPETTKSATTYSSGFSWNLGGQIGWSNGKSAGSINTGISLNSSYSYTINDVTVSNLCVPGKKLAWKYDLASASVSYKFANTSQTQIREGALAGRTSFTGGTDFIISFPESDKCPVLDSKIKVVLRSTCGKAGKKCGERTKDSDYGNQLRLPALSSKNFK